MKYLYNSKAKTIKALDNDSKVIKLDKFECRFIEVISNGSTNSWREISEYVYRR